MVHFTLAWKTLFFLRSKLQPFFSFFLYKTFDHFSHLSPLPPNVRVICNLLTPTLLCSFGVLSLFRVEGFCFYEALVPGVVSALSVDLFS